MMKMNFIMNDLPWQIIETSQEEMKKIQNIKKANEEENVKSVMPRYFGITYFDDLIIYLDKNIDFDMKIKTLKHELAHCYIGCYITHQEKNYDEEMVADIVSNSHSIISEIVNDYLHHFAKMQNTDIVENGIAPQKKDE